MVLQKVGEFQTTINVNGDQKVSTNQSSDKTYNLSESFTTDIQVNGSTQNSFTQTGDSVYNISTNPRLRKQGSYGYTGDNDTFQIVKTGGDITISKVDWYLAVTSGLGAGGFVRLSSENGTEVSVSDGSFGGTNTESGTIQDPNFSNLSFFKDADAGDIDYDIKVYLNGIEVNPTGVSQS